MRNRVLAGALFALTLLAAPARATWSIVVVNVETGEVGIASATCLSGFDLQRWLPVVVPEQGVAAAQSFVDQTGANRMLIHDGITNQLPPEQILAMLAAQDPGHQGRQYGIVTLIDDPLTFTGTSVGQARHGVSGQIGPWKYAVQGNVLTAPIVVDAAASALITTQGDMGQKLMAAMFAARSWGGDGRCSCSNLMPTSCGAPPPGFTKSAHVAFVIVARFGDAPGTCNGSVGCANGDYYLELQKITGTASPDPVLILRNDYAAWRLSQSGRPDHLLSSVTPDAESLPADGLAKATVTVQLRDVDGVPLPFSGATVTVEPTYAGAPVATIGAVTPLGGGAYEFELVATTTPGEGSWKVLVNDGFGARRLYPDLELRVDPPSSLHAGYDEVAASEGCDVPFVLDAGAGAAGRPYLLLGSATGTQPGQTFHGLALPLNADPFFAFTLAGAGGSSLPGSAGALDALGRASARYLASPADLAPIVGRTLSWCAVVGGPAPQLTGVADFAVVP